MNQGQLGLVGLEGPAGRPGPRGELGLPGLPGERGPHGQKVNTLITAFLKFLFHLKSWLPNESLVWVQGESGLVGERGTPGTKGMEGSMGDQGRKGDPGLKGQPVSITSNSETTKTTNYSGTLCSELDLKLGDNFAMIAQIRENNDFLRYWFTWMADMSNNKVVIIKLSHLDYHQLSNILIKQHLSFSINCSLFLIIGRLLRPSRYSNALRK